MAVVKEDRGTTPTRRLACAILMEVQRAATDLCVAEQQFCQGTIAQAFEGFPGALEGAVAGGAAGPDHGFAIDPQEHLSHMGTDLAQGHLFCPVESACALSDHLNGDMAVLTQSRGQRAGCLQPPRQGRSGRLTRPAPPGGSQLAERGSGGSVRPGAAMRFAR